MSATPREIPKHLLQRPVCVTDSDGEGSYASVGVALWGTMLHSPLAAFLKVSHRSKGLPRVQGWTRLFRRGEHTRSGIWQFLFGPISDVTGAAGERPAREVHSWPGQARERPQSAQEGCQGALNRGPLVALDFIQCTSTHCQSRLGGRSR